ncbi:OB-fold nucleic acid binding domain-containing protein [Candidatus Hecatella orcuttiae]|uniref:OB-fold nucleic acid binding domain-containing protein n=1 Tax=Candidatus Hecatella orcuttiae TaxID=1935119 RepID=UPI0028682509|nr:OB-fold nucleic acid binding domain-containing protein [Candidatus Hecatella orcuttiae]
MKVHELRVGSQRVNIDLKVVEKLEERVVTFRADGSQHRVADVLVGDESGCIILTLWDEVIDQVKSGDVLRIENGYISVFKSSLRLNVGRYGKLSRSGAEIPSVNVQNNLSTRRIQV